MTDPQRLLESKQRVSALERRVLDSAARVAAPPGAKDQIWSLLAPQIGAATGPASLAAKKALTTAIVKAVAVGALVGGTISGGAVWIALARSPSPSQAPNRPAGVSAPHPLPTSTPVRELPAAAPTPDPAALEPTQENPTKARPGVAPAPSFGDAPTPLEPMPNSDESASRVAFPEATATDSSLSLAAPEPPPSSTVDRARLESRHVAEARGLLRAGDPGAALNLLARVAREFPNGVLAQEREALSVEALLASGQRERARFRARAFLEHYANSPHSGAVRRALE